MIAPPTPAKTIGGAVGDEESRRACHAPIVDVLSTLVLGGTAVKARDTADFTRPAPIAPLCSNTKRLTPTHPIALTAAPFTLKQHTPLPNSVAAENDVQAGQQEIDLGSWDLAGPIDECRPIERDHL